ncbi:MAG: hypothetical protein ACI9JN_002530 [Bacteroidia bacterium]|jgi:uncharacterized protein (DUF302 family)
MTYCFSKKLSGNSFDKAVEQVTVELKKEDFGVLTGIDLKETLKNKIDVDFKKYKILGAYNPHFAYKALQSEDKIGVFLPCNVIVEEHEDGVIEVSAVDPIASMSAAKNETLGDLASKVQQKLIKVIDSLT